MTSFVEHTRAEIVRLREIEKKARAEYDAAKLQADTLQRALDNWQGTTQPVSQPQPIAKQVARQITSARRSNGHAKRSAPGAKNALALEQLRAAGPSGLTTDELFTSFKTVFGPNYKRSSLRSLLAHHRENGKVSKQGDRYVLSESPH